MIDDDRFEQVHRAARLRAIEAAKETEVDMHAILATPVPDCFGKKWQDAVMQIKESLDKDCPPGLYLYAAKSFAYAKNFVAGFSNELGFNCSPDEYVDSEGWASTLRALLAVFPKEEDDVFNHFESLTQSQRPALYMVLEAMAVLWFYDAARQYESKAVVAFDTLYEVSQAITFAMVSVGCNGAVDYMSNDSREKASSVARDRALAKHAAHAKAKEQLISLWKSGDYESRTECVDIEIEGLIVFCGKPIARTVARRWLNGIEKD